MGVKEHLKALGYDPSVPMEGKIAEWLGWYRAKNDFYESSDVSTDGRTYKVNRLSMSPARLVCQEWASLMLNERTGISCEDAAANTFLNGDGKRGGYLSTSKLLVHGQGLVERAMALGTGAWALRVEGASVNSTGAVQANGTARIVAQRFDARQVIPLSYDEDTCTECAFTSEVVIRGTRLTQLQVYSLLGGVYAIETAYFDADGKQVDPEGIAPRLITASTTPLFSLVRPGLENTHVDYSPFGVSVFDDAIGAVKLTDTAFDNLWRDIYLGQKMLFLDERLLDTDAKGNPVIPRAKDQQFFRKAETDGTGGSVESMIGEYNPDLRVTDNRQGLTTALEVLGLRTGLGSDYFSLDEAGGIKTATEIVSEHGDLFRNLRKHENVLEPALRTITLGILTLARTIRGESMAEDPGAITVSFDDSIIEDSDAQRKRDRDDVAAGLMQPFEYRMRWYGEDEAKARKMVGDGEIPPEEL